MNMDYEEDDYGDDEFDVQLIKASMTITSVYSQGFTQSTRGVDHGDNPDLLEAIKGKDNDDVLEYLNKRLESGKEISVYVKAVFKALQSLDRRKKRQSDLTYEGDQDDSECNMDLNVIVGILKALIYSKAQIQEKDLNSCIQTLLTECDALETHQLQDIINDLADSIFRNMRSCTLMMLPKCLMLRQHKKPLDASSKNDEHAEFQSGIIEKIVESDWPSPTFIGIISALNDISLTKSDHLIIIDKVLKEMDQLSLQELPPVVHQLTVLSLHGQKGQILRGISQHFCQLERNRNDSNNYEQLQMESTVIMQLNIAIKQDMDLGKDFIKQTHDLLPFNIALLLTISKIPRFKTQTINILKNLVSQSIKINYAESEDALKQTVLNSKESWDIIIEPLVDFCVALMDSNAIVVTENIRAMRRIGTELLLDLFDAHEIVRPKVIDDIVSRVQMKSDNLQAWFNLLFRISRHTAMSLLQSVPKLKESLEYIQYFSPNTVKNLILAFSPLFQLAPSFLDSTILTLKKALFKREFEARASAIGGFLQLIKNITKPGAPETAENLAIELLGIIKRGLSQQGAIRSLLYTGLKDLVQCRSNLGDYVCDILLLQFADLFDRNVTRPNHSPIDLLKCVTLETVGESSVATIVEPIDKLIHCIQFCLRNSNSSSSSSKKLKEQFDDFVQKMSRCDSAKMPEIHGSDDLFPTCSQLYIGIIESLIEYKANSADNDLGAKLQSILPLFALHSRIKDLQLEKVAQKAAAAKGKKGSGGKAKATSKKGKKRKASSDDEEDDDDDDNGAATTAAKKKSPRAKRPSEDSAQHDILSQECIKELLTFVYDIQSQPSLWKKDQLQYQNFFIFVHQSCYNYTKAMFAEAKVHKETQVDEDPNTSPIAKNMSFCRHASQILRKAIENGRTWDKKDTNSQSKSLTTQSLILSSIDEMIKYAGEFSSDGAAELKNLVSMFQEHVPASIAHQNEALNGHISYLESICIDSAIAGGFWTEADLILTVLSRLYPIIRRGSKETHLKFISNLYDTEVPIESPTLAATIVKAFLDLGGDANKIAVEIADYLLNQANREDDDEEMLQGLINKSTHLSVESQFLVYINGSIDRSKDIISAIKKDWSSKLSSKEVNQITKRKDEVCTALGQSVILINTLCDKVTHSSGSTTTEKLLKTAKKLFTVLTTLVSNLITLGCHLTDPSRLMILESSKLSSNIQKSMMASENNNSIKLSRSDKARIAREVKFLPLLAFTLEKYESVVIRYEKKLKLGERDRLGKYFQKAEIRDFKVDLIRLQAMIEKDDDQPKPSKPKASKAKKSPAKRAVSTTKKKAPAKKSNKPAATKGKKKVAPPTQDSDEDQYYDDDEDDDE
eukprot:gene9817-11467_t